MSSSKVKKIFFKIILLFSVLSFSSCKKCWECQFKQYKARYSNGVNTVIVEAEGNIAYMNVYYEYDAMGYYEDSIITDKIITEEYCGTKKEMEIDNNKNNTTLDKQCYPIK